MLVAIQNGHYDVATYLLNRGADPNLANEKVEHELVADHIEKSPSKD